MRRMPQTRGRRHRIGLTTTFARLQRGSSQPDDLPGSLANRQASRDSSVVASYSARARHARLDCGDDEPDQLGVGHLGDVRFACEIERDDDVQQPRPIQRR